MEHMIGAVIFPSTLDAEHVSRLGHHADGGFIPPVAGADGADLPFGQILAYRAAAHIGFRLGNGVGKGFCLPVRQGQHMESKALGALSADPGQRRKFINQIFQGCREK